MGAVKRVILHIVAQAINGIDAVISTGFPPPDHPSRLKPLRGNSLACFGAMDSSPQALPPSSMPGDKASSGGAGAACVVSPAPGAVGWRHRRYTRDAEVEPLSCRLQGTWQR